MNKIFKKYIKKPIKQKKGILVDDLESEFYFCQREIDNGVLL